MSQPAPTIIVLSHSQKRVLEVVYALPYGGELHNQAVAERSGLSVGWTSQVLRSLEKMGYVRRRHARSNATTAFIRYTLWRRA